MILNGEQGPVAPWFGLVDVSGRSYIVVRNLTVQYSTYAGLFADSAQHIVFQSNHTLHSYTSVSASRTVLMW